MRMTRRSMLGAVRRQRFRPCAPRHLANPAGHGALGLVIHSFAVRTAGDRGRPAGRPASRLPTDSSIMLDRSARAVSRSAWACWTMPRLDALRERAAAASMYLEGIVSLPRDQADVERFEAEIRTAKRAGAQVVRTVMLSGRRYETFATIAAFRRFAESSTHSLKLAAPVVARHDVRLAVENHKDWRADELIRVLKQVGNDHVGVCLDTGNSIALLEDPMEVVRSPCAAGRSRRTSRTWALEEYRDGFLLSEVPLGTGILDLPRVIRVVRAARPDIRLNLEMITRDPLKVPCLTEGYWATFPELPGKDSRPRTLTRPGPPAAPPLPRISQLPSRRAASRRRREYSPLPGVRTRKARQLALAIACAMRAGCSSTGGSIVA